jgi:hypothetical protein
MWNFVAVGKLCDHLCNLFILVNGKKSQPQEAGGTRAQVSQVEFFLLTKLPLAQNY